MIPICVQLSFDAADISGGGGSNPRSSTPFHIRLLNISEESFGLQSSTPAFTVKYTSLIYLFIHLIYLFLLFCFLFCINILYIYYIYLYCPMFWYIYI